MFSSTSDGQTPATLLSWINQDLERKCYGILVQEVNNLIVPGKTISLGSELITKSEDMVTTLQCGPVIRAGDFLPWMKVGPVGSDGGMISYRPAEPHTDAWFINIRKPSTTIGVLDLQSHITLLLIQQEVMPPIFDVVVEHMVPLCKACVSLQLLVVADRS